MWVKVLSIGIIILFISLPPAFAYHDDGTQNYIHSRGAESGDNLTDYKIDLQNLTIDTPVEGRTTKIHITIKNIGESINNTNASMHVDDVPVESVPISNLSSDSLWNHTFAWNGSRGEHRLSIYIGSTMVSNRVTYVNALPVIVMKIPESAETMCSVVFSAEDTVDPDGDRVIYSWNFGDGSKGAGAKVRHTYNSPGDYRVILTVTDARGGVNHTTGVIKISSPGTPFSTPFFPYILIVFIVIIIVISAVVLKRRGKKISEKKKVLPFVIEKSVTPEKEVKEVPDKDVDSAIHHAEEWINAIKLEGFDVLGAEIVLTAAKDFKTGGIYDKVKWYAKESERLAKEIKSKSITWVRMDALESIERSAEVINYIKEKGVGVALSERFIVKAKEYIEKEEYERATGYAKKAKSIARELEMRYAIDGRSFEPELVETGETNQLHELQLKSMKVEEKIEPVNEVEEVEPMESEELLDEPTRVEEYPKELVKCPACGKNVAKVWRICPYCDASMDAEGRVVDDITIVDEEIQTLEIISKAKIYVRNVEEAMGIYVPVAERYIKRAELAYSNKNFEKARKWAEDAMKIIDENT